MIGVGFIMGLVMLVGEGVPGFESAELKEGRLGSGRSSGRGWGPRHATGRGVRNKYAMTLGGDRW